MADLAELSRMIEAALPGAEVELVDEGGGDHLRAIVAAPQFEGLSRIDQHRLVRGGGQASASTTARSTRSRSRHVR